MPASALSQQIRKQQAEVLDRWTSQQLHSLSTRRDLTGDGDIRRMSEDFLEAYLTALESADGDRPSGPAWDRLHELVSSTSASRARLGFSPRETATFVFSLKQPLFDLIRRSYTSADDLARETWLVSTSLDRLGLLTTEAYPKGREEIIRRQQQSMLELSTPVVTLWKGILALPLIGTLDSERTQVVMESLLQRIVQTGASIAILDITGVPTVDTLVAQHLLKTVSAAP